MNQPDIMNVGIIVLIIAFIFRWFVCWYFKISAMTKLLTDIRNLLLELKNSEIKKAGGDREKK